MGGVPCASPAIHALLASLEARRFDCDRPSDGAFVNRLCEVCGNLPYHVIALGHQGIASDAQHLET